MSPNMMSNNNNQRNNVSRRGFYSGPRRAPAANRSAAAQGPIVPAPPVAPTKSAKQLRSEETLAEVSRALSETTTVRRRVLQGTASNPATYTIDFITLTQLQARTVTDNVRHQLKPARIMDVTKDAPTHPIHAQNEQVTEARGDVELFLFNLASVRRLLCPCGSVSAVPCVDEVGEIVGRLMSLRAPGNHDDGDRHKTGMTSAEAIAHAAADKLHSALSMVKSTGAMGRCECHVTAKATAAAPKKAKGVSRKKKSSGEEKAVVDVASSFVWADEMDQLEGEDVLNMDFSQPLFTLSPRH